MSSYTTFVLGKDSFEKHPCVSGVTFVPPFGYRINYMHAVKDGLCVRCGEGYFVSFDDPPWRDCENQ